jgi:putative transposase
MSNAPSIALRPEGTVYRWLTFGIPEILVTDNGKDLTAKSTTETAVKLGMSMQFTPVRTPWFKGVVERANGTTNTRLFHLLPGTTLGRALSHVGYDASKHAELTEQDLSVLLSQYFVTIHNPAVQSRRRRSANDLFLQGIQRHPPRMPASDSDLSALFSLSSNRVVQQSGIQYLYLQYQSAELVKLFQTSKSRPTVTISIEVTDIRVIRVQHPVTGRWFVVQSTRDLGAHPYPLARWHAHLGLMKEMGLEPGTDHDHARVEQALMRKVESLRKTTSSKARAAELRAIRKLELYGEAQPNNTNAMPTSAADAIVVSPTADVEDTLDAVFSAAQ